MPDPFIPPASTLPPLSDYDPLTDIDWETVRSIADEQGWVWDEVAGVYLDGETPVSSDDMLAVTYEEIERIEGQISEATSQLENGDITLSEWERSLAEITAVTAALFFLFGLGALGSITDEHSQHVKHPLAIQYQSLRAFGERIAGGQWSIADEQGWVWDDDAGQYLDDGGNPVDSDDILQLTYAEIERIEGQISEATSQLENGDITLSEWERSLAEITATTAALFFLFGLGALGSITDEHSQHVKDRLAIQYQFLRAFSERIAGGQLSIAAIVANANLYPQDAQLHFSQAQLFAHAEGDWPYYSNVLGGCQHCSQCPDETAQGIVERGTLTPIGDRLCKWRCCCMWAFHKTRDGNDSLGMPRFGWVGVKSGLKAPLISKLSV